MPQLLSALFHRLVAGVSHLYGLEQPTCFFPAPPKPSLDNNHHFIIDTDFETMQIVPFRRRVLSWPYIFAFKVVDTILCFWWCIASHGRFLARHFFDSRVISEESPAFGTSAIDRLFRYEVKVSRVFITVCEYLQDEE